MTDKYARDRCLVRYLPADLFYHTLHPIGHPSFLNLFQLLGPVVLLRGGSSRMADNTWECPARMEWGSPRPTRRRAEPLRDRVLLRETGVVAFLGIKPCSNTEPTNPCKLPEGGAGARRFLEGRARGSGVGISWFQVGYQISILCLTDHEPS